MKASQVKSIEPRFIEMLFHAPGTKQEKQDFFLSLGIQVPRTNYEKMWNSLIKRLGRSGAADTVFNYVLQMADSRLIELLNKSINNERIRIKSTDNILIKDLYKSNGRFKRIGEHLINYFADKNIKRSHEGVEDDMPTQQEIHYDVALSFAGEQRPYVKQIARSLKEMDIEVFYDDFEEVDLWGKDLVSHFDNVYRKLARYCIIFISKKYAEKAWPMHEARSALARAIKEKGVYILPVRFDDTDLPGIQPTIKYIDANQYTPETLAAMIYKKISGNSAFQDSRFILKSNLEPSPDKVAPLTPNIVRLKKMISEVRPRTARDEGEIKTDHANYLDLRGRANPDSYVGITDDLKGRRLPKQRSAIILALYKKTQERGVVEISYQDLELPMSIDNYEIHITHLQSRGLLEISHLVGDAGYSNIKITGLGIAYVENNLLNNTSS